MKEEEQEITVVRVSAFNASLELSIIDAKGSQDYPTIWPHKL